MVCAALYANALSYFQQHLYMAFFTSAVGVLQTLVIALGAGLGIWGVINLLEGYGNDNPGAKSQGMKQLMAGGGVALIGLTLVPLASPWSAWFSYLCSPASFNRTDSMN